MKVTFSARAGLCALGLALTGCAAIPLSGSQPPEGTPRPAMASKRVAAKEAAAVLIAYDYTRCVVGPDRFERTKVGDEVWCVWTGGGSGRTGARRSRERRAPRWSDRGDLSASH